MNERATDADSLISFRNSQGAECRATLMSLNRHQVVFEVYNPYSIVQLSEVLSGLSIRRGERTIYSGRAVVSNLVNTGIMLVVSATLVDPWSDLARLPPGELLRKEVEGFIGEWRSSSAVIRPQYRMLVSHIRHFFEELSRWLTQGEMVAGINDPGVPEGDRRRFIGDIESGVWPLIGELFARFEEEARQVPDELVLPHKSFARREVHPLILCAPFMHRTFTKPLGYAGDYEMVNMMLRDPWEGQNTYAKIVNGIVIRSDGAAAHRNRIAKLVEYLKGEARRVHALGRTLRVLNIACGPAAEVQEFLRSHPESERCHITLLDFNQETLAYTRERIKDSLSGSGRLPTIEFLHKSIHDLLKEARGRAESRPDPYDLVYCAGLFDYLSDKTCQRLLELFNAWVAPGGLLVATNVHPRCPVRFFIEHFLEWYLIYRDNEQMMSLAPRDGQACITDDPTRVNIFLEVRKPG